MKSSATKLIMGFALVAIGVASGIALIRFSEADDAPGGAILGLLIIGGTVTLGVRAAWRRRTGRGPAREDQRGTG